MTAEADDAVRQWQAKAQSDWIAVEVLRASAECPRDVVCFHAQQFAEKLLKALLTRHGVETPRTHDLRRLIELAAAFASRLAGLADRADALTAHGVHTRYPGDALQVDETEMTTAVELAREIGEIILDSLGT